MVLRQARVVVPTVREYTAEVVVVVTSLRTSRQEAAHCKRAVELLEVKGVPHSIVDLAFDVDWDLDVSRGAQLEVLKVMGRKRQCQQRRSCQATRGQHLLLPMVIVNGEPLGGYSHLQGLEDDGLLAAMLVSADRPSETVPAAESQPGAAQRRTEVVAENVPFCGEERASALEDASTDAGSTVPTMPGFSRPGSSGQPTASARRRAGTAGSGTLRHRDRSATVDAAEWDDIDSCDSFGILPRQGTRGHTWLPPGARKPKRARTGPRLFKSLLRYHDHIQAKNEPLSLKCRVRAVLESGDWCRAARL